MTRACHARPFGLAGMPEYNEVEIAPYYEEASADRRVERVVKTFNDSKIYFLEPTASPNLVTNSKIQGNNSDNKDCSEGCYNDSFGR